jgi:hypothetical protein
MAASKLVRSVGLSESFFFLKKNEKKVSIKISAAASRFSGVQLGPSTQLPPPGHKTVDGVSTKTDCLSSWFHGTKWTEIKGTAAYCSV